MTTKTTDAGAWAESRAEDIRNHCGSPAEASKVMLLLSDDTRAEAETLTERAEADLLRAKHARENSFAAAADELELNAKTLDARAKELMRQSAALEAIAMKVA